MLLDMRSLKRQLENQAEDDRTAIFDRPSIEQPGRANVSTQARKILDHRGQGPLSTLWPLAHLALARASAMQGDTAQARKSYQDFFSLWKDADQDLPILIAAKREFEKL